MTDSSLPAASQVAYLGGNTALASVCNCATAISVPHDTQIHVQVSPEQLLLTHWSPIQEADENRYLMPEVQTNSWSPCVRIRMELPPSPKKAFGSFNEAFRPMETKLIGIQRPVPCLPSRAPPYGPLGVFERLGTLNAQRHVELCFSDSLLDWEHRSSRATTMCSE